MNAAQLAELEDVKVTLRSLLVSSPIAMDLRTLARDFKSITGERIPNVKFGYPSLLDFLKERCSDYVLFTGDPANPIVTPIITEKSKHLNQLVSKQKISSNLKHKAKRMSVLESDIRPQKKPEPAQREINHCAAPIRHSVTKARAPFQHSAKENNLVSTIPIQRNTESKRYSSTPIQSNTEIESFSTTSIQRIPENKSASTTPIKRNTDNQSFSTTPIQRIPENKSASTTPIQRNTENNLFSTTPVQRIPENKSASTTPIQRNTCNKSFSTTPIQRIPENQSVSTTPIQRNHVVETIKKPIVEKKTYENVKQPNRSYTKEPARENHLHSKGAIPKTVEHYKNESRPVVKEHREKTGSSHRESQPHLLRSARMHYSMVRSNLEELMNDYPDGIWIQDLNTIYREKFNRNIDYKRTGYPTMSAMCEVMTDTLRLETSHTPGKVVVVSVGYDGAPHPPLPRPRPPTRLRMYEDEGQDGDSDDALPGVPYDRAIFPEDCMGHKESIPVIPLQKLQEKELYEVNISEVLDPSHFWFQLRGEDYDLAMEDMMDEMQLYYTTGEGKDRQMEFGAVQIGQYCATNFGQDGWHRSLIVQVLNPDTVKVRHIDYGSIDKLDRRQLRVLPRKWAKLPAQALRGSLAEVRPALVSSWTYRAGVRFKELIYCRGLFAKIHTVDFKNRITWMWLADTVSADYDIHMTKVLVEEGFAEFIPLTEEILGDYLLPSFDDLECGRAMNMTDKHNLMVAGMSPDGLDAPFSVPVIGRASNDRAHMSSNWQHHKETPATTVARTMQPHPQQAHQVVNNTSRLAGSCITSHSISDDSSEMSIFSHSSYLDSENSYKDGDSTGSSNPGSPMDLYKCKTNAFVHPDHNQTLVGSSNETLRMYPGSYSRDTYQSMSALNKGRSGPIFASVERKVAHVKPFNQIPRCIQEYAEARESQTPEEREHVNFTYADTHIGQVETAQDQECNESQWEITQQSNPHVSPHVQSFFHAAAEYSPGHYQLSTDNSRSFQPLMQSNEQYFRSPYTPEYVQNQHSNSQNLVHHAQPYDQYQQRHAQSDIQHSSQHQNSDSAHMNEATCAYTNQHFQSSDMYAQSYSAYPPRFVPTPTCPPGLTFSISDIAHGLQLSELDVEILNRLQQTDPLLADRFIEDRMRNLSMF